MSEIMEKNKIYKPDLKSSFVFFGTPEFAAIILDKLIKVGFIPEVVVCNPDRLVGRKKVITHPPVKISIMNQETSIKEKIEILQPENLKNAKYFLPATKYDFFIVAAYGKIIPKEILELPRLGVIGVHPSFLPKLRGPSPIQTTVLNGEEETGVTLFLLDEKVDHGPILAKRELENYESQFATFDDLNRKLAELGANLVIETLSKWLKGEIKPLPQDETKVTYTKMIKREDGEIDPKEETAQEIDRKIRALNPEPGTYIKYKVSGIRYQVLGIEYQALKILKANLVANSSRIFPTKEVGDFLIQNQRLYLKTKNGLLEIQTLQPEGKKPMTAKDFINGYLILRN